MYLYTDTKKSEVLIDLPGNRIPLSADVDAESVVMGQSAAIKRTNAGNLEVS